MKQTISVLIVTKNRAALLKRCLDSLVNQQMSPTEVVVVNNNSTDGTAKLLTEYKNYLPLIHVISKSKLVPQLYNRAAKTATSRLLAFLDDDCFVDKDWLEHVLRAHDRLDNVVIVGKTISVPRGNFYADVTATHYAEWLQSNRLNDNELLTADTKNVSLLKNVLVKNNYFLEADFSAHDIEFGMRIREKGIKIIYDKTIVVHHQERTNFIDFMKQHWRMAASDAVFNSVSRKRVSVISSKKNKQIIHKVLTTFQTYLQRKKVMLMVKTVCVYFSLLVVRIVGYHWKKIRIAFH
jgi:GT2 family glycosyltransferase